MSGSLSGDPKEPVRKAPCETASLYGGYSYNSNGVHAADESKGNSSDAERLVNLEAYISCDITNLADCMIESFKYGELA